MDITNYLKAGYPLIHVFTQETDRAPHSIKAEGWKTYSWDCLRGITESETGRTLEDISDPLHALKWLEGKATPSSSPRTSTTSSPLLRSSRRSRTASHLERPGILSRHPRTQDQSTPGTRKILHLAGLQPALSPRPLGHSRGTGPERGSKPTGKP